MIMGMGIVLLGKKLVHPAIQLFALSIQEFEGWYEGSVSHKNNNPGNIKDLHFPGTIGKDSEGHAIFKDWESGWNALVTKLQNAFYGKSEVYRPSFSIYEFFAKWAAGNSIEYARFVADKFGVSPETTLAELLVI